MRQARLVGTGEIIVEDAAPPTPGADEVLIRVGAVGICGSDVHAFHGRHPFIRPPIVLGHEFAGYVVARGSQDCGVREGDFVTVEPSIVCGRCPNCREGRYNICLHLQVIGCVGWPGAMAELIRVPCGKVVPLPREWSPERGALIEPAAVAIHAARRVQGHTVRGKRVLIFGAGPIGLMMIQAAKAFGAELVAVVDVIDSRLERARMFGADWVVRGGDGAVGAIRELWGETGVDIVFDCVAIPLTIDQGIQTIRKGCPIVIVGVPSGSVPVNLAFVQDRELELVGTLMYKREDFEEAILLVTEGRMTPERMITHRFPLSHVRDAFRLIDSRPDETCKVIIVP